MVADLSWESLGGPENIPKQKQTTPPNQIQSLNKEIVGDQEEETPQNKDWGDFHSPSTYQAKPKESDEDAFGYLAQNFSANASRVAEQMLGRYGNIEKMGKDILTNYPQVAGPIGWAISELMGPEKWENLIKGPKGQQQLLPTSEDIKKISSKATKGYTDPKTEGQRKFQEFTEDVGATLSGKIHLQSFNKIALNNLLTPVAANVAKEIVEETGFGKGKAQLAKAAVWLPLSLAFNVNAKDFAANLMNTGRTGYNANVTANIPRYQNMINSASRNMLQGDPRAALALQQISGIGNDISNGQTSIRDLMTRYDAINAAKRDRGLFALNASDKKAAIKNINEVRDAVRNEIESIGSANPQALESWKNGIAAFSTIHRSNAISNWVEGLAKGPYAKMLAGPTLGLFGIGSAGAIKAPIIAGPLAATTSAGYKSGQVLYRMWNDKNLSDYYWKAISAAQQENVPVFMNNYIKLKNGLEESSPTKKNSKPKK